MSQSSYNRQILATQAAAWISGDGATSFPLGCGVTRTATGTYKLILPTGEGVVDAQTFTNAQAKGATGLYAVVTDESEYIKTVRVFDNTSGSIPTDADVEVIVQRATINP